MYVSLSEEKPGGEQLWIDIKSSVLDLLSLITVRNSGESLE